MDFIGHPRRFGLGAMELETTLAPATEQVACTHDGKADFWLTPTPDMNDAQKGGLLLVSLLRGFSRVMKGQPLGGASCDISEKSILAIAGKARGIAIGPTLYARDACADARPAHACCSR